ncbi:MAG: SWIM zinc finger family protein [Treponema sp.]|jgi:hypothetical protein|nr:SWIM zinc finger family protein [Treponema sp.]
MSNIISLQETSPNHWQAKYQGNYGVYTIKITTDGKQTLGFSCSCPSSYYPCKHIAMIEEAIAGRIRQSVKKSGKGEGVSAEEVLKKLSREELYDFTARLVKNNPDLSNAVLLEFAEKIETKSDNKYAPVIRRALEEQVFDDEEYYYSEDSLDIDVLDQWFEKAGQYLEAKKNQEAVLIAQACIEEFASWLEKNDSDISDYVSERYGTRPFEILEKAADDPGMNIRALYDYCMTELTKGKYAGSAMFDGFNDLLMKVSAEIDSGAFLDLQQRLLNDIQDKASFAAEKILRRIIDFYNRSNQPDKAWKCIEENIQIRSFRKAVVEKKIEQNDFALAKKFIRDFIDTSEKQNKYYSDEWDDYLLQIAQKEGDVPAIRSISRSFINDKFNDHYYRIYKSTFTSSEWTGELEKLLDHYGGKKNFYDDSPADLLAAEGAAERLMLHIEKHLSTDSVEKYHRYFAADFPEKTLALFRKAIDYYAEQNTGRSYYERIADLFRKMSKIPGGKAVIADMKGQYKIKYRNRRAMMEVLGLKSTTSP